MRHLPMAKNGTRAPYRSEVQHVPQAAWHLHEGRLMLMVKPREVNPRVKM